MINCSGMGGGDSPWLIGEEAVTRSSGVTDRWTVALLCTDGRPATQTKSDTTVLVGISRPLSAESICPPCNLQSLLASHLSLSLCARIRISVLVCHDLLLGGSRLPCPRAKCMRGNCSWLDRWRLDGRISTNVDFGHGWDKAFIGQRSSGNLPWFLQ
jgi:hypothetical protein